MNISGELENDESFREKDFKVRELIETTVVIKEKISNERLKHNKQLEELRKELKAEVLRKRNQQRMVKVLVRIKLRSLASEAKGFALVTQEQLQEDLIESEEMRLVYRDHLMKCSQVAEVKRIERKDEKNRSEVYTLDEIMTIAIFLMLGVIIGNYISKTA